MQIVEGEIKPEHVYFLFAWSTIHLSLVQAFVIDVHIAAWDYMHECAHTL